MAQWYPKLAEYDVDGWQLDQYIAREFHGVWGDFDVTIHIDKTTLLGVQVIYKILRKWATVTKIQQKN